MRGHHFRDEAAAPLLSMEHSMGGSSSPAESDAGLIEREDAVQLDMQEAATDKSLDSGRQVMSLLKPVSLTMVLVVYLISTLGNPDEIEGGFNELMVYREEASDSVGTKAGGVLLNALAMVALLFVVTTLMLLLYKYRCYRVMYGWLLFSVASLLFSFGGFVLEQLLELYAVPADQPTLMLFLYNFSVLGTILVFWDGALTTSTNHHLLCHLRRLRYLLLHDLHHLVLHLHRRRPRPWPCAAAHAAAALPRPRERPHRMVCGSPCDLPVSSSS